MQPVHERGAFARLLRLVQEESLSRIVLLLPLHLIGLPGLGDRFLPVRRHRRVGAVDGFNEIVHVVGHGDYAGAVDDPVQGSCAHKHVLLAIDRLGAGLHRRGLGVGRGQPVDVAGRAGEPGRTWPLVAVKTPHALEDQINGRQIRHQQVEVDVERLLDHLRGDHDRPVGPLRGLPRWSEAVEEISVFGQPVADGEARMVETHVLTEGLTQQFVGLLCSPHRVADDECAPAVGQCLFHKRYQGILGKPLDAHRAAAFC